MIRDRLILALAAALLLSSALAGWSLWRLAGAGARCDARIALARLDGQRATLDLSRSQQAAIDALRAEQDAELMRAWARAQSPQIVARWRTRWRTAGPAPSCTVTPAQIDVVNEAIR